ncbi:MAG: bifunctional riboflavin kinase/FAD synthetase [Leptospiraceae bacterium]|nr:bifunctional riboflavin kinase/FAD synthetase [Leptospiraceae bacterium]MCB1304518.1 bifunctional riboflavin kinase/FAD synthetase [Leptospiraceae bacterium]
MHIVKDLENFTPFWERASLTLGVFDGMHRGHQKIIQRVQKRSKKARNARVLVTYHPHPDIVLGKRSSVRGAELFTYEEKLALFQKFSLDVVVFLPFTRELASMTALRYLREILLGKLRAKNIVIGYDQCFGRGRKGDFEFLKLMSKKYDFEVDRIEAVKSKGEIISTSRIRKEIEKGDVVEANRLLGHDYFLSGTVVRGFQRGQTIGFPTANLDIEETKLIPGEGVYGCVCEWGGQHFRAMVNVGRNPTFKNEQMTIEAFLLDFSGDLYGERLRLYFLHRLRDELSFGSVMELKSQLEKDQIAAANMSVPSSYGL